MGGPRLRRWDGVKQAINAMLTIVPLQQEHILVLVTGMLEKPVVIKIELEVDVIVIDIQIVHIIKVGVDLHNS